MAEELNDSTISDSLLLIVNNSYGNGSLFSSIPLSTIIIGIVCILGILANFLVLVVIILSELRTSVFMNLIICLSIFDTMFLFSVFLAQRGIFGEILIKPSLLYCRFIFFFTHVTGIMSSWVTVLISVERYIAIFYPLKAHIYCTKKRTLVTVIIITILACTSQIPLFFTCSLVFIGQRPRCISFISHTWDDMMFVIFHFMVQSFVPLIIITILNAFLIKRIKVQSAFRARSQGQHSVSAPSRKHLSLVAMMVCLCVVFALTSLPGTLIILINYLCKFTTGRHCIFFGGWLYHIPFLLNDINHGVNFFLYCLTGSVFRQALFKLFECRH